MIDFSRIGLIINPTAGLGGSANIRVARDVLMSLCPDHVVTGPDSLGATAIEGLDCSMEIVPIENPAGRRQTQELTAVLCRQNITVLVVIGGDGTMADVALMVSQTARKPPILGVGMGSTNVGKLITLHHSEINTLRTEALVRVPVDGLLAFENDALSGLGFNDCVIGYTVVATIDGKRRDVDVAAKMEGRKIPAQPRSIGIPDTRVMFIGQNNETVLSRGTSIASVVVGFSDSAFIGKAVTGGICLASIAGVPAGCLITNQPLVRVEIDHKDVLELPPLTSTYQSIDENSRIIVEGVREGAALCVDGNPLCLLTPSDRISFGVKLSIVEVLQQQSKLGRTHTQ
jgi:NAD kinase